MKRFFKIIDLTNSENSTCYLLVQNNIYDAVSCVAGDLYSSKYLIIKEISDTEAKVTKVIDDRIDTLYSADLYSCFTEIGTNSESACKPIFAPIALLTSGAA